MEKNLWSLEVSGSPESIDFLQALTDLIGRSELSDPYAEVLAHSMLAYAQAGANLEKESKQSILLGLEAAKARGSLETAIVRTTELDISSNPYDREAVERSLLKLEATLSGNEELLPQFLHRELNRLANLSFERNEIELCERILKLTIPDLSLEPGESLAEFLYSVRSLSNINKQRGGNDATKKFLERIVELNRLHSNSNDDQVLADHQNYINILKPVDREPRLRELLQLKGQKFGEESNEVAYTLVTLGYCYSDLDQLDKSEQHFQKALEIRKNFFEEPDVWIAEPLLGLGAVYCQMEKFEDSLSHLEKATFNAQSVADTASPMIAYIARWTARSMNALQKEGAIEAARRSLTLQKKVYGDDDPLTKEAEQVLEASESGVVFEEVRPSK